MRHSTGKQLGVASNYYKILCPMFRSLIVCGRKLFRYLIPLASTDGGLPSCLGASVFSALSSLVISNIQLLLLLTMNTACAQAYYYFLQLLWPCKGRFYFTAKEPRKVGVKFSSRLATTQ